MKGKILLAAVIASFGMVGVSQAASPVCEKLKISANQLAAFQPHDAHGKAVSNRLNDAVACLDANWEKLSQRLTLRNTATATWPALIPNGTPMPTVAARYSPSAMYNANTATPIALLKQPDNHLNYQPTINANPTPLQQTQLHLMDEVPTANYQGSLSTPVAYQTGHWNRDIFQ